MPPREARAKRDRETPLYQLIVNLLQSEILRGVYPVGAKLPSEQDLIRRFKVSRHTVRAAVRALQDMGLAKTHHGLGTLVQPRPDGQHYVHRINTISDLFPLDVETRLDPIDTRLVDLPASARFFPDLDDGRQWLRITGARYKRGAAEPFNEVEIYVAARFAGVARVVESMAGSVYAVLEALYAETICEVEQVIGGFIADGQTGSRIGLKDGDAGIEVRRIHRVTSDNQVGILSLNRYPNHEYTFSMILRRVPN